MKLKLATRLSAFFLVAVAVILLCFSSALYFATRLYLHREMDERLRITLDVLEASIDIEPEGMEWEPVDRRLNVGTDRGDDQVRWAVYDRGGTVVGHSLNAEEAHFPPPDAWHDLPRLPLDTTSVLKLGNWRLAGRTLRLRELLNPESARDSADAVEDDVQHEELLIVAGLSPGPVEASLRGLLLVLVVATGVVWTLCGLFGRRLVLWAMFPVREIASAAKNLNPGDSGWHLPSPGTADELDDLAEAFNQLLARLRDAFDRQRRFTGDASHQLRTPLAGILGQLDVALLRERSPQDYRQALAAAREEARRLRGIVDSLLLLARTEAGPPASTTCLELRGWLRDHMSRWGDHPRHADLHYDLGDHAEAWVRAEPELLAQAFHNLIDNGLKYSEPGSPLRVELSCSSDTAKVTVSDSGRGIAVASHIVEVFAGSISVDSEFGKGSRFTVRLPLVRVDKSDLCTA